jgi:hypothetical protein
MGQGMERLEWKRITEINPNPKLFGDKQSQIKFGIAGDCYLTAVLELLDKPEYHKSLFYTREINQAGCYIIYFYVNGLRTPVLIDDRLPKLKNGKLAFASCENGEFWAALVEKAWAKLHGSYVRIENSNAAMLYNALTGLPCDKLHH